MRTQWKVTKFSEWDRKTPLWPAGSRRRYVVLAKSSEDGSRFIAYGVERPSGRVVFTIEGEMTGELVQLSEVMRLEGATVLAFPRGPAPGLWSGDGGDPPPSEPPGMAVRDIVAQVDAEALAAATRG